MIFPERLLQRMQGVAIGEPFDGANFLALGLHAEHQAGADRLAVDQHGAGAADAVLTAEMGAGQPAIVAQHVGQRPARLDRDRVGSTVDGEIDAELASHGPMLPPCGAARESVAALRAIRTARCRTATARRR